MNGRQPRNFWPSLAMFLFAGHGLGANGFFTRMVVWLSDTSNP